MTGDQHPPPSMLALRRHVTVIVRLVLGRNGELVYGDLLDVDGVSWQHFTEWHVLLDALREYVRLRQ